MIGRTAVYALAFGCVFVGKVLVAARLRRKPDGWRRTVGVTLRGEASKFALSAFGLNVPVGEGNTEERLTRGLLALLQTEPEAHYRLNHGYHVSRRVATQFVDLVVQRFAPDGTLEAIEPHFAPGNPDSTDPATRAGAHAAIVAAYNHTRSRPEAMRPLELLEHLRGTLAPEAAYYVTRVLSAVCVSFEPVLAGTARFGPPDFPSRCGLGFGFLAFVVRPDPTGATADVWARVHHVGADGGSAQEAMSRLARAWGGVPVAFPDPGTVLGPHLCSVPGEPETYETTSFHDFAPLLALRKRLNARLGPQTGGEVTLGGLLIRQLAREPEFAGLKFSTTLEVPAADGHERGVDFVALTPADPGTAGDAALVAYASEFNRLVTAARGRSGPTRQAFMEAELLPAWLHATFLKYFPERVRAELGDVCVSLVRDAQVLVGVKSDVGLTRGFIAVGNVGLPAASGGTVGAVSVKGTRADATAYPEVIRRALRRCEEV